MRDIVQYDVSIREQNARDFKEEQERLAANQTKVEEPQGTPVWDADRRGYYLPIVKEVTTGIAG